MKVFTQLCAVLAIMSVIQVSEQQDLISPCPKVFSYDQERLTWVGTVVLPTTNIENDLNLEVVMSLKRPLPSTFQGYITLKDDLITVFQNIINGRKITYTVTFPLKVEIPSVVSITFNGQNYCEGVKPKKYATIIRLEHKNQLRSVDEATTRKSSTARAPTRQKKPSTRRSTTTRRTGTQRTSEKPVTTASPHYELDEMYSEIFKNMEQENILNKRPVEQRTSRRPETTVSAHYGSDDEYTGIFQNMGQENIMRTSKRPNKQRTSRRPETTVSAHYDLDDEYTGIFQNMGQEKIVRPNDRPNKQRTSRRPETTVSAHYDLDDEYTGIFQNMGQEKIVRPNDRPNKQRTSRRPETTVLAHHVRPNKKSPLVIPNVNNQPKDEYLVYSDYLIEKPKRQQSKHTEESVQKEPSDDIENYDENDPVKSNGQLEEDEAFRDKKESEKYAGFLDIRTGLQVNG